jgi:hypothetical protein
VGRNVFMFSLMNAEFNLLNTVTSATIVDAVNISEYNYKLAFEICQTYN